MIFFDIFQLCSVTLAAQSCLQNCLKGYTEALHGGVLNKNGLSKRDFFSQLITTDSHSIRHEKKKFRAICRGYKKLRKCVLKDCGKSALEYQIKESQWNLVDMVCLKRRNRKALLSKLHCLNKHEHHVAAKCNYLPSSRSSACINDMLYSARDMSHFKHILGAYCQNVTRDIGCVTRQVHQRCDERGSYATSQVIYNLLDMRFRNFKRQFSNIPVHPNMSLIPAQCYKVEEFLRLISPTHPMTTRPASSRRPTTTMLILTPTLPSTTSNIRTSASTTSREPPVSVAIEGGVLDEQIYYVSSTSPRLLSTGHCVVAFLGVFLAL